MPGLVKIGMTNGDSVEARMAQLSSSSGVPLPFECHFAAEVDDCARVEKLLHQLFAEHRVNPKREFFKIEPEKAVIAINIGNFLEITPGKVQIDQEEMQALEKANYRRPKINLEALGIKPGDQLSLSRDSAVTATVLPGGRVDFQGEEVSLSAVALKALQQMGYKSTSVSGSGYWMFEGELLDERRVRLEAQQFESANTD